MLAVNTAELFSRRVVQRTGTRDITQAAYITRAGNELVALANHWPSRSGAPGQGREYSLGFRCTAGEMLGYWHDRGDVLRAQSAKFYNLSWRLFNQPVTDHRGKTRELDGTLYFGCDTCVFDQIPVAKSLLGGPGKLKVNEASTRIEAYPEMVDHRATEGAMRFGLPKGDVAANTNLFGYSDHFPVSVLIDEV